MGSLSEEVRTEVLSGRICDLEQENAKLRTQLMDATESMGRVEERFAKLRELFYEAWDWMQRARYDRSIRDDEMDEIGSKAVKLGLPDYELGVEMDE